MKSVKTSALAAVLVLTSASVFAQDPASDANGQAVTESANQDDDTDLGWIGLLGLAGLLGLKRREREPAVRESPRTI